MERGYVKLWRKTLDSGILQHPAAWQLFGYLLLKTSHRPHRQIIGGVVFDLKPGEVAFGRQKAAADLGLSEKQIRTALDMLKKLEIVDCEATNRCTTISFVNWHRYQEYGPADGPADGQADGQANGQQAASNGPAAGHEQELRIKNILNTPPYSPPVGDGGDAAASVPAGKATPKKQPCSVEFERFWKAYPKKRGKDAAFRAWEKRRKAHDLPPVEALLAALDAAGTSREWRKDGGQFIPYPATWLNQGRWADDFAPEPESGRFMIN